MAYFPSATCRNVQIILLDAISHILARVPAFTANLAEAGFFLSVPINRDTLGRAIGIFAELVFNTPQLITPAYADQFAKFASLASDNVVDMLVYMAPRGGAECALAVADIGHPVFSLARAGGRIVHMLGALNANPKEIAAVVAKYLDSSLDSTIIMACRVLCAGRMPVPELKTLILIRLVLKPTVYMYIYHLLARVKDFEPSVELLNAFLLRPAEATSWALIAKLADSPGGSIFLRGTTTWLDNAAKNVRGAFTVFMLLFQNVKTRKQMSLLPQYPGLLKLASELNDAEILIAISHIARKGEIKDTLVTKFSTEGLWKSYFESVSRFQNVEVQENCMAMVDAFCRVGWTEEFSGYLRYLAALLQIPELANGSIRVMVALSCRKESIPVIRELNVLDYFQNLRQHQYYAQLAEALVNNVMAG
jgi:hypothetical protein